LQYNHSKVVAYLRSLARGDSLSSFSQQSGLVSIEHWQELGGMLLVSCRQEEGQWWELQINMHQGMQ